MDTQEMNELLIRVDERVYDLKDKSEKTQEKLDALAEDVTSLENTVNTVSEKVKAMIVRYKWPSPKYLITVAAAVLTALGVAVPQIL